jgi:hypothetical protein
MCELQFHNSGLPFCKSKRGGVDGWREVISKSAMIIIAVTPVAAEGRE